MGKVLTAGKGVVAQAGDIVRNGDVFQRTAAIELIVVQFGQTAVIVECPLAQLCYRIRDHNLGCVGAFRESAFSDGRYGIRNDDLL
jgi:hypothetical protein